MAITKEPSTEPPSNKQQPQKPLSESRRFQQAMEGVTGKRTRNMVSRITLDKMRPARDGWSDQQAGSTDRATTQTTDTRARQVERIAKIRKKPKEVHTTGKRKRVDPPRSASAEGERPTSSSRTQHAPASVEAGSKHKKAGQKNPKYDVMATLMRDWARQGEDIQTQRTWRHYFVSNMKKYLEGEEPELIDRLLKRPEKLYPYQSGTSEEQLLKLINNNVKKLGSQHWSINISSVIRSLEMCNAPCPGC